MSNGVDETQAWIRGFATALVLGLKVNHDNKTVKYAMCRAALTVQILRNCKVMEEDVLKIQEAIR